jgi:hypothetical protein
MLYSNKNIGLFKNFVFKLFLTINSVSAKVRKIIMKLIKSTKVLKYVRGQKNSQVLYNYNMMLDAE